MLTDHAETRACLIRAFRALQTATDAVRITNLPPGRPAQSIARDLDRLDTLIEAASAELDAARSAAATASRRGLRIVPPA